MASRASEREGTMFFTGGDRGAPMIIPRPCSSGSKKLSIRAFIWCIYFFCTRIGSFRILKKAGVFFCASLFLFLLQWKSDKKKRWFFQVCKNCDQEIMNIPKLNVLYQISPSQDSKNIFLLIRMSFNHGKMFVWNASI